MLPLSALAGMFGGARGALGGGMPAPPQQPSNRDDPPPPVGIAYDPAWKGRYAEWQSRNPGWNQQSWHAANPYDPVAHEAQLDQMRPGWRAEFPQQPPSAESGVAGIPGGTMGNGMPVEPGNQIQMPGTPIQGGWGNAGMPWAPSRGGWGNVSPMMGLGAFGRGGWGSAFGGLAGAFGRRR